MKQDRFSQGNKSVNSRANKKHFESPVERAKQKAQLEKEKFLHKPSVQFAQGLHKQRGLKNKLKYTGQQSLAKAKSTEAYKKFHNLYKKIYKIVKYIIRNIKWIGATVAIVTFGFNIVFFGMSIFHAIGATPHYYCELKAPLELTKTKAYQQYCNANGASNFQMDNLNGHYIVQDGSGPCWACAYANLYLRYFTKNNINFYDYLWQEDGQYPVSRQIQASYGGTLRTFIPHNSELTNTRNGEIKYKNNPESNPNGVRAFGRKQGHEIEMACWGYLRDSNVDYTGQAVGVYDDLKMNDNWVWDLSYWNSYEPHSTWSVELGSGDSIKIDEVTGTLVVWNISNSAQCPYKSGDDLRKLLDEHPSGVVVYTEYPKCKDGKWSVGHHGVLITGYDEQGFLVVDSGKGCIGGFEGPVRDNTFCITKIFTDERLNYPLKDMRHSGMENGCYVLSIAYIEEDKP